MGNMNYCRFRNTLEDLKDCYDNWDDGDEEEIPNKDELKAKEGLLKLCINIVENYAEDVEVVSF